MPAPPDQLLTSDCPGCGYSLRGSPPRGNCPECGQAYDASAIVLHGFGMGQHADLATARPWVAGAVCVAVAAGGVYGLWSWLFDGRGDPLGLLCAAGMFLWLGLSLWKRWRTDMPGLVQVILGPHGCCQINNPTPLKQRAARMTPWRRVSDFTAEPMLDGAIHLRVFCRSSWWTATVIPVDAEVRLTSDQAAALRDRVAAWRAADISAEPV